MKFSNNSQRMAVMARLRQAGFSQISSSYIMKKINPVKVIRETDQYIILKNGGRAHVIKKPGHKSSSRYDYEKRIDALHKARYGK